MAAAVVYEGDVKRSEPTPTQLFAGQKLWFSRSVPSRAWLMQNAEHNGAQVVQLEQQADIKLVDHARKNQAPGTHSYKYVELSIRNACLEDLEAHRVGSISRVDRPVGSVVTAGKGTRNKFTDDEDQLLWNWVKPYMEAGGAWKGLEIYKQLEKINPNHTYQSWRDRWIKHVQYSKRRITADVQPAGKDIYEQVGASLRSPKRRKVDNQSQVTPQRANISVVQTKHDRPIVTVVHEQAMGNAESSLHAIRDKYVAQPLPVQESRGEKEDVKADTVLARIKKSEAGDGDDELRMSQAATDGFERPNPIGDDDGESGVSADSSRLPLAFNFTQSDARMLYKATCHILDARADKLEQSWAGVAKEWGHTKDAWRRFFYDLIVPEYMKRHGIESDEELEIHYKAKVREQRQQQKVEERMIEHRLGNKSGEHNMEVDQLMISTMQERRISKSRAETSQNDGASDFSPVDEISGVRNSEYSVPYEKPLEHAPSSPHRPPKPNESRKLSQGKSSQSTSSQVRSQQSSQTLQHPQRPGVVIETTITNHDSNGFELSQVPRNDLQPANSSLQSQAIEDRRVVSLEQRSKSIPKARIAGQSPILQPSEALQDSSSRFVTQFSYGGQTTSTEGGTELQDIPYRGSTPPLTRSISESPLFVPEDPERQITPSPPRSENDDLTELLSSPLEVRLIEGENLDSEHGRSSEYAPSEAPSEGINFESEVRLSQAWETAPERALRADIFDGTESSDDESISSKTQWQIRGPETSIDDILEDGQAAEDNFETAPVDLIAAGHVSKNHRDSETLLVSQVVSSKQLDTQALFQLPVQNDLTEIAAIPEPPDGWEDENPATLVYTQGKQTNEGVAGQEADWTLPLPDSEADSITAEPEASKQDDVADLDNWLANQPKIYTTLPSTLLGPLSHRALETASMDLDLASVVLARMAQRFEKGKHPAHRSLSEIRTLPRQGRKTAILEIVEDLIPTDMPGCWTRDDDHALLSDNGRAVQSVQDKHGEEAIQSRFQFLELWFAK